MPNQTTANNRMLSPALQGDMLINSSILSAQLLFARFFFCFLTYLLKNTFPRTSCWFHFFPQTLWNPWQLVGSDADWSVLKLFQPCLVNRTNRLLPTRNPCLNCDRGGMCVQLLPRWRGAGGLSAASSCPGPAGWWGTRSVWRCLASPTWLAAVPKRGQRGHTGGMAPGCAESCACRCSAPSTPENGFERPFKRSPDAFIKPSRTHPALCAVLVEGSKEQGQEWDFYEWPWWHGSWQQDHVPAIHSHF